MKRKIVYIILIYLLSVSSVTHAQLRIQNFSIAQGLPQSQVSCLAEDSLGYLWVGTLGGGLSRFDGATFTTFSLKHGLPSNSIRDIHIVDLNQLWVATEKGVSFYNGSNFKNYNVDNNKGLFPVKLFAKSDTLFFLNYTGELGIIYHDSVRYNIKHGVLKNIKNIFHTPDNKGLFVEISPNECNLIFVENNSYESITITGLFTLIYRLFTHHNQLFISTDNGLYTIRNKKIVKVGDWKFPIYGYDRVTNQFIGKNGFTLTSIKNGIASVFGDMQPIVTVAYTDREENLWLASEKGLFKLHSTPFVKRLNPKDEFPVTAIYQHEDETWVGTTNQGLLIYKGSKLLKSYNLGSTTRNYVGSIKADRNGVIWVSTRGGIATVEKGVFNWIAPDKIKSAYPFDFDKRNNGIFGSPAQGLYRVSSDRVVTPVEDFKSTIVTSIKYNEQHDFFIIGTNVGVWKYDQGKIEKLIIPELDNMDVYSLDWLDSNTLVVGTFGHGLFLYSLTDSTIIKIDESVGLNSNTIYLVTVTQRGIWVGTERGIDLVQVDAQTKKVNKIHYYGDSEGLTGVETNLDAYSNTADLLQIGLIDGVYSLQDTLIPKYSNDLHIDEVKLFYDQVKENNHRSISSIDDDNNVHLFSFKENHLTFEFNKVYKRNPNTIYFKYKLEGSDQIWSRPSLSKSATYSNLEPGNYSFTVLATDKSGTFQYDKTNFIFTIEPAFYQTLIFKIALALLTLFIFLLAAYFYNKIRIKRALNLQIIKNDEQAKLRKEIARDFHDELGNQMARMINYVGLLRIKRQLETDIYETLHDYSQRILGGTKDFVWALDPSNDELGNLIIHLKDFGERMFQEKNIEFRFEGDFPAHYKLPMGHSRQINLIFKEAMTNAFKHSQASAVSFNLDIRPEKIILILQDNGKGIPASVWEKAERGIDNMKIRAHRIHGVLQFSSHKGNTQIQLYIPTKLVNLP